MRCGAFPIELTAGEVPRLAAENSPAPARWCIPASIPTGGGAANCLGKAIESAGAPTQILNSLKAAMIVKVSDDRKARFVSVSDAVDPHELMGRKPSGDFMIWFFVDPGNGSLRPSGPMKTCKRCQAICKT